MYTTSSLSLAGASLSLFASLAQADASSYVQNAGAANNRMLSSDWYHDGIFWDTSRHDKHQSDTSLWWTGANVLTTAINTMALDDEQKNEHQGIINEIYTQGPSHNAHFKKMKRGHVGGGALLRRESADFFNSFNDDEGWWALAWIRAHDLTNDIQYLNTAIDLWNDMTSSVGMDCPGLISQQDSKRDHAGTGAIAESLYITLSASIANRVGDNVKQTYRDAAEKGWAAFQASGMLNGDNNVNDGVNIPSCTNNNAPVYTYNNGQLIGALVELNKLNGDASLLDTAVAISKSSIAANGIFADGNGIIKHGDAGYGDGDEFNGVLMRNLGYLYAVRPSDDLKNFLFANAQSIWNNAFSQDDRGIELGSDWAGPFEGSYVVSQNVAIDAINAAAAAAK